MTKQFAVFGNPIEHSKSPPIHQHFAKQFDLKIDYQKLLSTTDAFADDLELFFNNGGNGCNVTVPFKEQAYALCHSLTTAAQTARAVNTLYRDRDSHLCGHNSDGAGLVNDLVKNHQTEIADANILILGAGGATRGILEPLICQRPASITVANRTKSKADKLASEFDAFFPIKSIGTDLSGFTGQADLLINATSASLSSELPIEDSNVIGTHSICYDLAYAAEPTTFLQWTEANRAARSIDGKGMLVEQAAVSFYTWTNLQPETRPVIEWFASN